MTKFQFFLVTTLVTSVILLLAGSREGDYLGSVFPIAIIVALSSLANKFISEPIWDKVAVWANGVSGRRIFRTKPLKRLPPSKLRRLR